MAVKNIECQIARGQIGRYLSGDAFSPEAIRQLEGHISGCAVCKGLLAERKKALQAMLGGVPTQAVVEVEAPARPKPAAKPAPKKADPTPAKGQTANGEDRPKPVFTRPMAYATALSLLLLAVSYFTHNGADLLGPKAKSETAQTAPVPSAPVVNAPALTSPDVNSLAANSRADGKTPAEPVSTKPSVEPGLDPKPNPSSVPLPAGTQPAGTKTTLATESTPKLNAEVETKNKIPNPPPPAGDLESEPAKPAAATPKVLAIPKAVVIPDVTIKPRPRTIRRSHRKAHRRLTVDKPKIRRTAKPHRTPKSRVRVYDQNGEPIS